MMMANRPPSIGRIKIVVTRIILICLGILVALVLVELGLRLIPRDDLNSMIEGSSRLELYRLDRRIGWSLRSNAQTIHFTRDDGSIKVETNALGLRDRGHAYLKPPETFRILILGDSFAEAKDVQWEESFPHLIEQCLNQRLTAPIEVINGGVLGYGPAEEYLFYVNEGLKYDPNLVLLVTYVGNDLSDLDRNNEHRLIRGFGGYRFSLDDGNLSQTWISWENAYGEQASSLQLFLRRHSLAYRVLTHPESKIYGQFIKTKDNLQRWLQPQAQGLDTALPLPWYLYMHSADFPNNPDTPQKSKEIWLLFQAIVNQLHVEVEANDSQLATIIIPTEYQVHQIALERTIKHFADLYEMGGDTQLDIDEPNRTILRSLEQQQIPTLDLLPYFRAHDQAGGNLLYFAGRFPQHLNKDGQKLIGDLACDWLINNKSIGLPRLYLTGNKPR